MNEAVVAHIVELLAIAGGGAAVIQWRVGTLEERVKALEAGRSELEKSIDAKLGELANRLTAISIDLAHLTGSLSRRRTGEHPPVEDHR